MNEIENPMVIDSLWRKNEQEPQVFGECAGCQEDVVAGDDYYEVQLSNGEKEMVHQNADCCMQYVGEMAWCRTAGEV